MPLYEIQGPDGKTYQIQGPSGATRQQIIDQVKMRLKPGDAAKPEPTEPKKDESFTSGHGPLPSGFGFLRIEIPAAIRPMTKKVTK